MPTRTPLILLGLAALCSGAALTIRLIQLNTPPVLPTPAVESTAPSILSAIIAVESGGDPSAIGDSGAAVGILQIHPIMVADVNRILSRPAYTLEDRLSPARSIEMFTIYTSHYTPSWEPELVARRWNGGPRGHLKPSTLPYWHLIQSHLANTGDTP